MVSANPIAPGKEEEGVGLDVRLNLERRGSVPAQTSPSSSAPDGDVVGIIGLIVVAAILSLSAYFVVRYLL